MSSLPPPLPPPQPIPKKGLSGCAIAAIVVGVLIGLVALVAGVGGYVFYQQAGGKAGVMKSALGVANPDYDIIDLDDKEKTITVRHKKTGKGATIPLSRLKNSRIDPADLGMTEQEAEGTAGAPDWVKYPGARQIAALQALSITTLGYETTDPADKVMEYYKTQIGNRGVETSKFGQVSIIMDDAKSSLQVQVKQSIAGRTIITIVYRKK
jgi:hypothetical protein